MRALWQVIVARFTAPEIGATVERRLELYLAHAGQGVIVVAVLASLTGSPVAALVAWAGLYAAWEAAQVALVRGSFWDSVIDLCASVAPPAALVLAIEGDWSLARIAAAATLAGLIAAAITPGGSNER